MKVCSKCKIEKDESEFYDQSSNRKGKMSSCKDCIKKYRKNNKDRINKKIKEWRVNNPEKQKLSIKNYKENNIDKCKELNKKWSQSEKAKKSRKEYFEKNKDSIYKKNKIWRENNPEYRKEYERNRKINNIQYYIVQKLRNRMRSAIIRKSDSTFNLIGLNINDLIKHFEQQFNSNISWLNKNEWHIDHIIPCSAYDLTNIEEQKKCFNFMNLRPCNAKENLEKNDKLDFDLIKKHNIEHLLPKDKRRLA